MVSAQISGPLLKTFDTMRRLLGSPVVYVVPWQVPAGLSYDPDVDAWLDGDGDVVTRTPAQLTYYEVPALWGSDAGSFSLALAGLTITGGMVAIVRAEHRAKFDTAMEVVTGTITGERYTVERLENAPDGRAAVFVVASLQRRRI